MAVAAEFTVITTVEVAAVQGPPAPSGSFVVNVRVTVPVVIDGVYVDVKEDAFEKVPLGALHVELVALPPIVPANVIVPPAHTVCVTPASAVAACVTLIVVVALTAEHGPAGSSVVNVNVTVPEKLAAGV